MLDNFLKISTLLFENDETTQSVKVIHLHCENWSFANNNTKELSNGFSIPENVASAIPNNFSKFITKFEIRSIITSLFHMRSALPEVSELLNAGARFTPELEQTLPCHDPAQAGCKGHLTESHGFLIKLSFPRQPFSRVLLTYPANSS